jgi:hypothetical protein
MCVTGLPVPEEPSPKFQANEYGPVPPLAVAVKVTCWLAVGEVGVKVKSVVRAVGATVMGWDELAVLALESVTVTLTVNVPLAV